VITDVLVAGAGASGLFCALHAARGGASVIVREAGPAAGRKILASGNGRCNLTNLNVSAEHYHGGRELARAALANFGGKNARDFFETLGVMTVEEDGGRIFPRAGRSGAVLTPLLCAATEAGARIELNGKITAIRREGGIYKAFDGAGGRIEARNVVLACGSAAASGLGGGMSGYSLAESFGHAIIPPSPALVPLRSGEKGLRRLAGIRVHAALCAKRDGRTLCSAAGETLFTDYGLSGPAALNLSAGCAAELQSGPLGCEMNLFPDMEQRKFMDFFSARAKMFASRPMKHFFAGMLHETVANLIMDIAGIDRNSPAGEHAGKAAALCQRWEFTLSGTRPMSEAMAAAGGVKSSEINPDTMESRLARGLFITGELLEPVGESGGCNLHLAWATGRLAGLACASGARARQQNGRQ